MLGSWVRAPAGSQSIKLMHYNTISYNAFFYFGKAKYNILKGFFRAINYSWYFLLKVQNKKFCVVLNGVWWSVVKQYSLSKDCCKSVVIDASEYCLIQSPLHFLGPCSENVATMKCPPGLIEFDMVF